MAERSGASGMTHATFWSRREEPVYHNGRWPMFLQYSEGIVRAKMRELDLKARKPAVRRAAKK